MSEQNEASIRLAGIVRESIVDGPGIRFVVFTQGCPHHCEGCHNPETHDFTGGYDCRTGKLLAEIDKNPLLRGVTISGGEPFCQPEALLELLRAVKQRGLNLMVYTGYLYETLLEMARERPAIGEMLLLTDLLVDGPFLLKERDLTLRFRGSRNQRIIDLTATRLAGEVVLF